MIVNLDDFSVVELHSCGDYWTNRDEFSKNFLEADLKKPLLIDMCFQGISLIKSGAHKIIQQLTVDTGRNPSEIYMFNPNHLENFLEYQNLNQYPVCDEFLRMHGYWAETCNKPDKNSRRFGHFIGRPTTPRIKLFFDIEQQNISQHFLLSKLRMDPDVGYWKIPHFNLDCLDKWFPSEKQSSAFDSWYSDEFKIDSIDELSMSDQYDLTKTARKNIVDRSALYHIDIVFEGLTDGLTFAPTEKLIRSLITEKPFIVYAAKNYMAHLKNIGFKTFDTLWDENYDNFEQVDRYDLIFQLINKLANLSDNDFLDLMEQTHKICQHNKELLAQLNVKYHDENWITKIRSVDLL